MRRYLLDTNILSDLVRHPEGRAARKIAEVGEESVCTSLIVACELRYGAAKKRSASLSEKINQLLSVIEIRSLEDGVDKRYGEIRSRLEKSGTPIGANDMLIAAHAASLDLVLVSDNTSEFARIPGLLLENWLQDR